MNYKKAVKYCKRGEPIREATMPPNYFVSWIKKEQLFILTSVFGNSVVFEPTAEQEQSNDWSLLDRRS